MLMLPYSLRLAWLNLLRNGRRSALSILIISIAIFALTAAGGFGLYTYDALKESTATETGHLIFSQPGYFESDEEMPLSNGLSNTQQLTDIIMQSSDVKGVQPRIDFTGLISNGSKSTIFMGIGANDKEFAMKGPFLDMKSGKTLSDTSSSQYDAMEPEIMLGVDLAKNLNVNVGDWVTLLATTSEGALNAFDFKVHGTYSTGIPEVDKRQLYIDISSAQELLLSSKISTLSVFLADTEQTPVMHEKLNRELQAQALADDIEITPWQDRAFFYKKVKDLYNLIFGVMGCVMGLVVFVALFNTMTTSVTERTREIGTLSALGAYPNEIINSFLREAGLIAAIGVALGGLMTAFISILLQIIDVQMPPPPGKNTGYPLNIYFSIELVAYAGIGIMIICLFAAYLSARKGVKKPITEALIYV